MKSIALSLAVVASMFSLPQSADAWHGRRSVVVQSGGAQVVSVRSGVFGRRSVTVVNGGGFVAPAAVVVPSHVAAPRVLIVP